MITGIGDEVEVIAGQFKGRIGIVDSYPERNIEGSAVRVRLSPGFSVDAYIRDLRRGALTPEQRQAFQEFDVRQRRTTSIPPPTESDVPLGLAPPLAVARSPVAAAAERVVAAEVELKNAWLDLERSIDQEVRERSNK